MKATYDYETEKYEFLNEIDDHLTTKPEYGDDLIIDCQDIRINGVKVPNADCIQLFSNVTNIGIRKTRTVKDGATGETLGESQYIEPLVELWETTDGMRLHDLRFKRQIGVTGKYKEYHYILE